MSQNLSYVGSGRIQDLQGNMSGLFCFGGFLAPDTLSHVRLSRRDTHIPKPLSPTTFHRHNRPLRTFLLESEVWFCASDLGRLMGWRLNERTTLKLEADQRRVVTLIDGQSEPWIRLRDMPQVLAVDEVRDHGVVRESRTSWWRSAVQVLRSG
jgi:hypothetical protein